MSPALYVARVRRLSLLRKPLDRFHGRAAAIARKMHVEHVNAYAANVLLTMLCVLIVGAVLFLSLPRLKSSLGLNDLQGMGSPATADEADDSYRTLGVGRSLPGSHYTRQ